MATYDVIKNNCNHFTGRAAELLIGQCTFEDIVNQGTDFMQTPFGKMLEPMLSSAQENLKVSSNPIFNQDGNQKAVEPESREPAS